MLKRFFARGRAHSAKHGPACPPSTPASASRRRPVRSFFQSAVVSDRKVWPTRVVASRRKLNAQPIKVLLVEDEQVYADLLMEILRAGSRFELLRAGRLDEALTQVRAGRFDAVLLDLSLPDRKGLATYQALRAATPGLPIVVLTGSVDETLALQAVREGAQDYLVKGEFNGQMLARVILYAIERKRAEEELRQNAEFFKLISENVSDLIAVLDRDGNRLYNSPSYRNSVGNAANLQGTDSFQEIHPDDKQRIRSIFQETIATGIGRRSEYRLLTADGSVRHIESLGNVIKDDAGQD